MKQPTDTTRRFVADEPADHDPVARLIGLVGPRPVLDDQRVTRMKAAVRPHWQHEVEQRRARHGGPAWDWRWGLAAAAALLAAVGLTFWRIGDPVIDAVEVATLAAATGEVLVLDRARAGAGVPIVPGEILWAGEGIASGASRAALRLPGGVSVRLDHGTRLRLLDPKTFALDQGAIYVDTDGSSPLRVQTGLGLVEDIGTQFEVRLVGRGLRLRVREGAVVLHHDRGSYEGRRGEELLLRPGDSLIRTAVATWGDPWQWVLEVSAAEDFDGQTLDPFLAWVARESGLGIRFSDPELQAAASGRVRGNTLGLTVDEALATVLPTYGLGHRFEEGEVVIVPLERR